MAFAALPNIFTLELDWQVVRAYGGVGSYYQTVTQTLEIASFLMSPCLFFLTLYVYGKRTARHFSEGYLGLALSLFVGSCIGLAIYIYSIPIIEWGSWGSSNLSLLYSFDSAFNIMSEGVRNAFIGIAALALSHLRTKPSVTLPEVLPEPRAIFAALK